MRLVAETGASLADGTAFELGRTVPYFTCPLGRQHQNTEENRKPVEETGFTRCLSANGGGGTAGDVPVHLKRTPVSPCHTSPFQFRFETMLVRS